jgi:hypothetical protein
LAKFFDPLWRPVRLPSNCAGFTPAAVADLVGTVSINHNISKQCLDFTGELAITVLP